MNKSFEFIAISVDRKKIRGTVKAANEDIAYSKVATRDLQVIYLKKSNNSESGSKHKFDRKTQTTLLRQFGVLIEAKVDALETLESMKASSAQSRVQEALEDAAIALRSGKSLAESLAIGIPGLNSATLALINAGDEGGCLAGTVKHAVNQLEAEERVSTAIKNALVYPAFLVISGFGAALVMLTFVIPQFAQIIGEQRHSLNGLPAAIFWLGSLASETSGLALLAPLIALACLATLLVRLPDPRLRMWAFKVLPFLYKIHLRRQQERWCRIMAFALAARIPIIDAMRLAMMAVDSDHLRSPILAASRQLRFGASVSEAIAAMSLLDKTQISLVRAAAEAGTLPEMLERIADDAESSLASLLKNSTIILEQFVIIFVSLFIGIIVYSLVSSLTSVYESISI